MKKEKTSLIKPKRIREKETKNYELILSIVMLMIGIILFTNSNKAIVIICYIIGVITTLFGSFNLLNYYRMKNELNIENNFNLITGVLSVFIGIIIIILASAIENFLRFIIGLILLLNGLKRIKLSIDYRLYFELVLSIILIALGLYTILAENIIFNIIGLLLIISSTFDIFKFFQKPKK